MSVDYSARREALIKELEGCRTQIKNMNELEQRIIGAIVLLDEFIAAQNEAAQTASDGSPQPA